MRGAVAHLLRLILCAFALAGVSGVALAAGPTYEYHADYNGANTNVWLGSEAAACASAASAATSASAASGVGNTFSINSVQGTVSPNYSRACNYMAKDSKGVLLSTGYTWDLARRELAAGTCVVGMEAGPDGICVCKAGTHDVGGSCEANKTALQEFCESHAAPKNTFNQKGTVGASSPTPQSSCYKPYPPFPGDDATKGCAMTLRDIVKVPADGGLMNWSATGIPTGATCSDAAATDNGPKAVPDKCPVGFAGTFNGSEVCIPPEPDKGIEGVKTTSSTAANGTKTDITETTKCQGTVCTTTTTTKNTTSAGAVTTSSTSVTQSLADKCVKDPVNKVCTKTGTTGSSGSGNGDGEGSPSSFGGSCVSGFKAQSEDAVLNAMAEEQYRRNCQVLDTTGTASQQIAAEIAKTGNQTGDNPNNSDVSIGSSNIDTSDALGGGGCSLDKTFSVRGQSFTLPFNVVCDPLAMFGQLLVAVSMLLAARIVTRG